MACLILTCQKIGYKEKDVVKYVCASQRRRINLIKDNSHTGLIWSQGVKKGSWRKSNEAVGQYSNQSSGRKDLCVVYADHSKFTENITRQVWNGFGVRAQTLSDIKHVLVH